MNSNTPGRRHRRPSLPATQPSFHPISVFFLCFCALLFADSAAAGGQSLAEAALQRTELNIIYDGRYRAIDYPNGDVPSHIGVCTDVIIRSYRALGIDLQQRVHEDMASNFSAYPSARIWGLAAPDTNIDHRRVPNLRTFFERHGQSLAVSNRKEDYQPGDIVTWMLPGNLPHIGIVSDRLEPASGMPLVIHNIGAGPVLDNSLFLYPLTGHYRYRPTGRQNMAE